jgi:hypothetical protein
MDAKRFVAELAARLGIEAPSASEIDELLAAAGVAAHGSERIAAPLSTYLIGKSGLTPKEGLSLVKSLTEKVANRESVEPS